LLVVGPEFFRQGASALLVLSRSAEAASPYAIKVTPGDATVPKGSDQSVSATLTGFRSTNVAMMVQVEGETGAQRMPLVSSGDGGTFDIGLQALSGAAERNEDILYCCYDNEAYMNTGVQRSSATPWGAWTSTTPVPHPEASPKKDILAILAAHRIPYAATASVAYPVDLLAKVRRARAVRGTRFLHILAPCPPGWKSADEETIELARMAVQSRIFPLLEVEDGERWRLTVNHAAEAVEPYLRRQGRFRHLSEEQVARIQADVDARWGALMRRVDTGVLEV